MNYSNKIYQLAINYCLKKKYNLKVNENILKKFNLKNSNLISIFNYLESNLVNKKEKKQIIILIKNYLSPYNQIKRRYLKLINLSINSSKSK